MSLCGIFPFGNINGFHFLAPGQFLHKAFLQKGRVFVILELSGFATALMQTLGNIFSSF